MIYAAFYLASGFNYLASFWSASLSENPNGFLLLAQPALYVFTRLQGVLEIVVFYGPYLAALSLRGLPILKEENPELFRLTILGILSLLAIFASGAFKFGETARVCLFIYPYLLFPIVAYLEKKRIGSREEAQIAILVFGQTVLMQSLGRFFW